MNGEWEMVLAAMAGTGIGVMLSWICWKMFAEDDAEDARAAGATRVVLEQEVTPEDVRSFFAKCDAVERNVPVAMIGEWKQMAAEKMAAVQSAEQFAFEQGRLAAFGEMEKAFLEVERELRAAEAADREEEGER